MGDTGGGWQRRADFRSVRYHRGRASSAMLWLAVDHVVRQRRPTIMAAYSPVLTWNWSMPRPWRCHATL